MYFGLLLLAERFFLQNNILKVPGLRNVYTIFAFIFGWVIFRAESIAHIGEIFASMFGANGAGDFIMLAENEVVQIPYLIAAVVGIILSMPVSKKIKAFLEQSHAGDAIIDVSALAALTYCVFSLVVGSYNPFIYFIF
jgi:alginate O-acetyltransferase complex protein AlgI